MKLVVWDFHGVMEKDNEKAVQDISNRVLEELGFKERFNEEETHKLYGLKWYQYFEYLLPSETNETHMKLQDYCQEFGLKNLDIIARYIKPNDNIHDVLKNLDNKGYEQILISNTAPEHLNWFIKQVKVDSYFQPDKVFGVNGHKEKAISKTEALRNILDVNPKNKIISIGDSIGDVELAIQHGGKSILYCHPGKKFPDCDADFRINNLNVINYLI